MKKIAVDSSLVLLALATVVGVTVLANIYLTRTAVAPDVAACTKQGENHFITITNDVVDAQHTDAKLCDTLTIMNKDAHIRIMAFGPHDRHITYDGVTEQVLAESQSFTVVLNKAGTYAFHDHDDYAVSGTFTVSKN